MDVKNEVINVLIVDDSAFMRKIVADILSEDKGINILASANDGLSALELLGNIKPDVITLDLEMPKMDGIQCLREIQKKYDIPVVMISSTTIEGANATLRALEDGAIDFIPKPDNLFSFSGEDKKKEIIEKVKTAARVKLLRQQLPEIEECKFLSEVTTAEVQATKVPKEKEAIKKLEAIAQPRKTRGLDKSKDSIVSQNTSSLEKVKAPVNKILKNSLETEKLHNKALKTELSNTQTPLGLKKSKSIETGKSLIVSNEIKYIIAIGTSTGGPRALQEVIPKFPADIPAAIVIVQHMPPQFTKSLSERLNTLSNIVVKEAEDNEKLKAGHAYVAPGDFHMLFEGDTFAKDLKIKLDKSPTDGGHRPSVNMMMRSLSDKKIKEKVVGVIMTGMGADGSEGLSLLKNKLNSFNIAQDEKSCVVFGMPRSAIMTGNIDITVPLGQIADEIIKLMGVQ